MMSGGRRREEKGVSREVKSLSQERQTRKSGGISLIVRNLHMTQFKTWGGILFDFFIFVCFFDYLFFFNISSLRHKLSSVNECSDTNKSKKNDHPFRCSTQAGSEFCVSIRF